LEPSGTASAFHGIEQPLNGGALIGRQVEFVSQFQEVGRAG